MKHSTKIFSKKNAQFAVEFIATYGWAILIIMVAIGALAYLGISDISKTLPNKCIFNNGIICSGASVTADKVTIALVNGQGKTIYDITAELTDISLPCNVNPSASATGESRITVECEVPEDEQFTSGEQIKLNFRITYTKVAGGYTQISLGEIYNTVG
ncbi:MAG: hypothetical protein ACP5NV_00460 [Candidatus Woesearchaeota archaeon]